jgi:hypothetical protein
MDDKHSKVKESQRGQTKNILEGKNSETHRVWFRNVFGRHNFKKIE